MSGAGSLSKQPLSVPLAVSAGYCIVLAALACVAFQGGVAAVYAVALTGGFSFQFWTYAAWRGNAKAPTPGGTS